MKSDELIDLLVALYHNPETYNELAPRLPKTLSAGWLKEFRSHALERARTLPADESYKVRLEWLYDLERYDLAQQTANSSVYEWPWRRAVGRILNEAVGESQYTLLKLPDLWAYAKEAKFREVEFEGRCDVWRYVLDHSTERPCADAGERKRLLKAWSGGILCDGDDRYLRGHILAEPWRTYYVDYLEAYFSPLQVIWFDPALEIGMSARLKKMVLPYRGRMAIIERLCNGTRWEHGFDKREVPKGTPSFDWCLDEGLVIRVEIQERTPTEKEQLTRLVSNLCSAYHQRSMDTPRLGLAAVKYLLGLEGRLKETKEDVQNDASIVDTFWVNSLVEARVWLEYITCSSRGHKPLLRQMLADLDAAFQQHALAKDVLGPPDWDLLKFGFETVRVVDMDTPLIPEGVWWSSPFEEFRIRPLAYPKRD